MKKMILAAVAVMAAISANAQGFEWGVKAGVSGAWLTEFNEPMGLGGSMKTKDRTGFYAGAFAERGFNERFGVQAELLYMQMGMSGKTGDISYGSKTDYLALPVLAKFYVWKGLSVDAGPQFAYMLSAKDVDGDSYYDRDGLKKFDMSVVAGLSYRITNRFDVTARLNLGLSKVYENARSRNRSYSLGVGYRF